jgi:hypothetical protein
MYTSPRQYSSTAISSESLLDTLIRQSRFCPKFGIEFRLLLKNCRYTDNPITVAVA